MEIASDSNQAVGPVRPFWANGQALLAVAAVVAIALTARAILPLSWAIRLLAALAWLAVPGVVLARRMYGRQPGVWSAALLAGPMWGYAVSSLVLLAMWALGVRSFAWLMLAPVPATLLVWPLAAAAPALTIPQLSRRDLGACALVLLTVPAVVGLPFAHVGQDLPEGRAYRAYFTADFVWQMTMASEVAKGEFPPQNPFFANGPLHYYWLMHLFPAVAYRAAGSALRVEQPLLLNAVWSALAFMAFLYFFTRHFVEKPWAAALACVGVMFCSSFEGLERILIYSYEGETLATAVDATRYLNIDSVTGWFYGSLRVDGLHRLLLYQPQHQAGYLLGFSAVLLLVQVRGLLTTGSLFLAGVFLGLSLLMSPFATGIFAAIVALCAAWRLVPNRQCGTLAIGGLAASLALGAAFGLVEWLQYADPQAQVIVFGVNPLAVRRWPMALYLSFGPVMMVALAGLARAVRHRILTLIVPLGVTLAVSFAFYFLVDVPDSLGIYVGFHVGKIIFAALVPLCGLAFEGIWALRVPGRVLAIVATLAVALAALPTVLIDLYNAQDTSNRAGAPFGGPWTLILTPGELAGLDWIKKFTPKDARVQMEPIVRERGAWAYIPAFAERRMAAGMPTSMVPLDKYQRVSDAVRAVYQSQSADDAHARATTQCIDYLVIGDPERAGYPGFEGVVSSNVDLFRPAFKNGVLDVYAVQNSRTRPQCHEGRAP